MQAPIGLGIKCISPLMPHQRETDGLGDRFERAIIESWPQTTRGTDHRGAMLHGRVETTHNLLEHVIDDANAADLPAQDPVNSFASQLELVSSTRRAEPRAPLR